MSNFESDILAALPGQTPRAKFEGLRGLVSENEALNKLLHALRPYIRDLNGENYDRPAAGLYQFDRTLDELAIEVEKICNTQTV